MQASDNMQSEQTAPSVSVSGSVTQTDTQELVKNWPATIGFDDVFTQDALLDEGLALLRLCCDWMTDQYTKRGWDVDHLDSSHPLTQARFFLRQFDDLSSTSEVS